MERSSGGCTCPDANRPPQPTAYPLSGKKSIAFRHGCTFPCFAARLGARLPPPLRVFACIWFRGNPGDPGFLYRRISVSAARQRPRCRGASPPIAQRFANAPDCVCDACGRIDKVSGLPEPCLLSFFAGVHKMAADWQQYRKGVVLVACRRSFDARFAQFAPRAQI